MRGLFMATGTCPYSFLLQCQHGVGDDDVAEELAREKNTCFVAHFCNNSYLCREILNI